MEVFIGNIPPNLDTGKIERFIFAVVNTEQVFGSGAIPSYGSSTPPAPPATTAIVPINKGFFFKRVPRNEGLHLASLLLPVERWLCGSSNTPNGSPLFATTV